jgi:NAD(P)-dependent dehydrogenase (short-subunit alcohol dehydrogenase family)
MLPLLETGTRPCVANVTSATGCIADKTSPGYYAYGTSKAALNYVTRAMAAEFKESGFIVIAISPGWVKTAMGGPDAELAPEKSAKGIVDTIARLTTNDTSCWFNWDGKKRDSW